MKEDECGKTENKGEEIDDEDEIFRFEVGNRGRRVWMVLADVNHAFAIGITYYNSW
jgi:hypothetical protein